MKAMGEAPAAMIVLFVAFLGFCFVGVLSCFHAYLVATNQTTYERLPRQVLVGREPAQQGFDRQLLLPGVVREGAAEPIPLP